MSTTRSALWRGIDQLRELGVDLLALDLDHARLHVRVAQSCLRSEPRAGRARDDCGMSRDSAARLVDVAELAGVTLPSSRAC